MRRAARRYGSKIALAAGGRTFTYRELDEVCDRVAPGLRDLGVRPGDRVSLYSPNRWEWIAGWHATFRAGAALNPINVMLTAEAVAFVLNDCGSSVIITSGEKAGVLGKPFRKFRGPAIGDMPANTNRTVDRIVRAPIIVAPNTTCVLARNDWGAAQI